MRKTTLVICAVLMFVGPAAASQTSNWGNISLSITGGPLINVDRATSRSIALVDDSLGNRDEDESLSNWSAMALAQIGTASASAEIEDDQAQFITGVAPGPGMTSNAYSDSQRSLYSDVGGPGEVTIELQYELFHSLQTERPGDSARSLSMVGLGISDGDGNRLDIDNFSVEDFAYDGDTFGSSSSDLPQYRGTLTVTGSFGALDLGSIVMALFSHTTAYTAFDGTPAIPAPAALFLGGIGAGCVGWRRRMLY